MTTKEMCVEIDTLRGKINDLNKKITQGVYNYLNDVIGIKTANSPASKGIIGKVVAEEFGWYWNREQDLITIYYCVFRNEYGDISNEKETNVDFSVIDKYYNK